METQPFSCVLRRLHAIFVLYGGENRLLTRGSVLLRFTVENFRSLRDRQMLSLLAGAVKGPEGAVLDSEALGVGLLRVLALYGANASGKTGVLRALFYMGAAVRGSQRHWAPEKGVPRDPFLLDRVSVSRPSYFEADLLLDGVRYTYGFEVDSQRVLSEWLFAYPNRKKQTWFERVADRDQVYRFGKALSGENRVIQNLTRSNSLFLSAAAQNGHQQLLPIYKWFTSQLEFVNPSSRESLWMTTASMCENPEHRRALLQLLASADLGIIDVEVTEQEIEEKLQRALQTFLTTVSDAETSSHDARQIPRLPKIGLKHEAGDGGVSITLPFDDESDGTRALFALSGPVIRALESGGVLCVDELDSSLHPLLALGLVRTFNDSSTNPKGAQLISNTHDTNLLDGNVLRRDQIWFAEKDSSGATQLYPLSDFKPRRQENLERGYLQGRYGAVPFVGRFASVGNSDGE